MTLNYSRTVVHTAFQIAAGDRVQRYSGRIGGQFVDVTPAEVVEVVEVTEADPEVDAFGFDAPTMRVVLSNGAEFVMPGMGSNFYTVPA